MRALDIPPHPRSDSRLAAAALALLAAGALANGFLRQVTAMTPEPAAAARAGVVAAIPEATPAPDPILQVAEAPPPHRTHALGGAPTLDAPSGDPGDAAAAAVAAPAADASAVAPEPPPPTDAAAPAERPNA